MDTSVLSLLFDCVIRWGYMNAYEWPEFRFQIHVNWALKTLNRYINR